MDIKEYIKNINKTLNRYDKCAKNPFLDYKYAYNPFKDAISQTYVWIEKERVSQGVLETGDEPGESKAD